MTGPVFVAVASSVAIVTAVAVGLYFRRKLGLDTEARQGGRRLSGGEALLVLLSTAPLALALVLAPGTLFVLAGGVLAAGGGIALLLIVQRNMPPR